MSSYTPLDLVEAFYRKFIAYPSEHALVAHVLWTSHTHLVECFDTTPRLAFMSPEKDSGKTRALEITALFASNAFLSFSASTASIVRKIAKGYEDGGVPTILYDEIDNVFGSSKMQQEGAADLRAALNAGYRRGAMAVRCTNHGANITEYPCFAPLAMAGLRTLPDTLASRSIFVHMRRRAPNEEIEPFRHRYHPEQANPIANALIEWCDEIEAKVAGYEPTIPGGIVDRNADCWEPLLAIAEIAGGDWPARARAAAIYLTDGAKDETLTDGVELLSHVREAFDGAERIWTETLLQKLCNRDESPWKDIHGKPLNDRGLASRLKPYGVKSGDVKISGTNHKGYLASQFADAWNRYLPDAAGTSATSATSATFLNNKNNLVAPVAPVAHPWPEDEVVDNDPFYNLKDPSLIPDLPNFLDRRKSN